MSNIKLMCRTTTTFTTDGKIDEKAMRWHFKRLVDAKIGVFPASGGVGEAYAMTMDEIRRVYELAVDECKGKVQVYANPPEQHTASETLKHARVAIETGCDAINLYPSAGWHGYRPRDEELRIYYETLLKAIDHPVTMTASAVSGFMPSAQFMADLANRFSNVVGINMHAGDRYFVELKDRATREIDYYCHLSGSLNEFLLGANGFLVQEATIIPKSFRAYVDLYERGEWSKIGPINAGILRFVSVVLKWAPGNARWTKMCMKLLKMPGWEGGLRPPNQMPAEEQLQQMLTGLKKVSLAEMDEMLRAAGHI